MKTFSILERLLQRGDMISIQNGRLVISPLSNKPIPDNWYKQHSLEIVKEIAILCQTNIWAYESYTTGRYPYEGVCLNFSNTVSGETAYSIYNAILTRQRTTNHGEAGTPLPRKSFIVGKRSTFYKFWSHTGLKTPRKLSEYHSCMGRLKPVFFDCQPDSRNRVMNKIIPLVNITYSTIKANYERNISQANNRQFFAKPLPNGFANNIPEHHTDREVQRHQTTYQNNHDISIQEEEIVTPHSNYFSLDKPISKSPKLQSNEEWLDDYSNS